MSRIIIIIIITGSNVGKYVLNFSLFCNGPQNSGFTFVPNTCRHLRTQIVVIFNEFQGRLEIVGQTEPVN